MLVKCGARFSNPHLLLSRLLHVDDGRACLSVLRPACYHLSPACGLALSATPLVRNLYDFSEAADEATSDTAMRITRFAESYFTRTLRMNRSNQVATVRGRHFTLHLPSWDISSDLSILDIVLTM
jgi:hypothetical protein